MLMELGLRSSVMPGVVSSGGTVLVPMAGVVVACGVPISVSVSVVVVVVAAVVVACGFASEAT